MAKKLILAVVVVLLISPTGEAQQASEPGATNSIPPGTVRLAPLVVTGAPPGDASGDTAGLTPVAADLRATAATLDLGTFAPNLMVFQGISDRSPQFSLRGLRENNLSVGEPQVTLYVDDVPYDDLYTRNLPLYGLESVELFRGPQGTRRGASSPGGVLEVRSRPAGDEPHAWGIASYGNYDAWRGEAGVSGPLVTDTLQAGLAGFYFNRDGYVLNTVTGDKGDTRETAAGRFQLRWTPGERLELVASVSGHAFNDGLQPGTPLGAQDIYTVSRTFDGYDEHRFHAESLRATYRAEQLTLSSITAYTHWRESLLQDSDYQPADIARTTFTRDQGQWSQEFRANSTEPVAGWDWLAGAFYANRDFSSDVNTSFNIPPLPVPLNSRSLAANDTDAWAAFGQVSRDLGEHFEIIAGLRWEYTRVHGTGTEINELAGGPGTPIVINNDETETFDSLEPRVEFAWKPEARTRLWAGVARGSQPGGFSFNAAPAPTSYAASDSWHFELGGRTAWWADRIEFRTTVFYNDIEDYQVFRPTGFGNFSMLNAGRAHSVGAEFELTARATDELELSLGGGLVSAEFDRFTDPNNGAVLDGREINFVPAFTFDANATWRPWRGFFAQAGAQVIGPTWFDEANTTKQDAYTLVNARVGWQAKHWGVAWFGRNLLDERYAAGALQFSQPPGGTFFVGIPGEPLMFGVECFLSY